MLDCRSACHVGKTNVTHSEPPSTCPAQHCCVAFMETACHNAVQCSVLLHCRTIYHLPKASLGGNMDEARHLAASCDVFALRLRPTPVTHLRAVYL